VFSYWVYILLFSPLEYEKVFLLLRSGGFLFFFFDISTMAGNFYYPSVFDHVLIVWVQRFGSCIFFLLHSWSWVMVFGKNGWENKRGEKG
jgi:hypothetical protein